MFSQLVLRRRVVGPRYSAKLQNSFSFLGNSTFFVPRLLAAASETLVVRGRWTRTRTRTPSRSSGYCSSSSRMCSKSISILSTCRADVRACRSSCAVICPKLSTKNLWENPYSRCHGATSSVNPICAAAISVQQGLPILSLYLINEDQRLIHF